MDKILMIAADVHDRSMLAKYALGRGEPGMRSFANRRKAWAKMAAYFQREARRQGAARIVFAYEASGFGANLFDFLWTQGIECFLLAPTKIKRSEKDRRSKTDERDALLLLDTLRGHFLAGSALPTVTVPDGELRDDRRLVRTRLDVALKASVIKVQIQWLLKDVGSEKPEGLGASWSKRHRAWLAKQSSPKGMKAPGARASLGSLLRQLSMYEAEIEHLDGELVARAQKPRYAKAARALDAMTGVRMLTAMVFLTEMGDVTRFHNRREVGAYMGLVPASRESGQASDRKGHITRQGPARLRRVLCQATWARIRWDEETKVSYGRIVKRNPKKKMIGVVACMRRLGIRMWHEAVRAMETA